MLNAIWSTGILNGSPSGNDDAEISPEEYDTSGRTDSVLHIFNPTDLPPFIFPNQRLVFHLPGLPERVYTLHIATTGGNEDSIKEEYFDLGKLHYRQLSVRWNDHLVWQRWCPPVFTITKAAIPTHKLSQDSNLLTLENVGTQVLPLDAIWIQEYTNDGPPFYLALESAEWLNRSESKWVQTVALPLFIPSGSINLKCLPSRAPTKTIKTAFELQERWPQIIQRFQLLQHVDTEAAAALRPWAEKLHKAQSRGMLPAVQVEMDSGSSHDYLDAAIYVFGDMIHSWILPAGPSFPEQVKRIRALSPDAFLISSKRTPTTEADAGIVNLYPWSYHSKLVDEAKKYVSFFRGENSTQKLKQSLRQVVSLRTSSKGYINFMQAFHSDEFYSAVADQLMLSDQPVIIHGGFPGSPEWH